MDSVNVSMEFLGGVAIGGATGGFVTGALEKISFIKQNPEMSGTIIGGVKGAAGYYLMTQQEGDMLQGIGAAWFADGVSDLIGGFISGVAGFRSDTLGTSYSARHNRKHRVLGTGNQYAEMPSKTRRPLRAKVASYV